jgi:hypothetical protein
MSAPLDFVRIFAAHLRQADIGCAITSGMACVHYGLQQITKDTDWIIPADDLAKLRELFARLQGALPPWRVSYRQICGAPLEAEFMANGWTSHLSIWDSAGSVEHKVDLFSKPPRVRPEDMSADAEGWASQHVVAQMKKTDRDKDWPIVDGLGRRMWGARLPAGLLHMTRLEDLQAAWTALNEKTRLGLAERRPLLKCLARSPPPTRGQSDLLLLLERLVWQRVNKQRYGHYVRAWKEFYRRWRQEEDWVWPTDEPFAPQHQRLRQAAAQHGLPPDPLAATPRDALVQSAVAEILAMERFTAQDIAAVMPPVYELLP